MSYRGQSARPARRISQSLLPVLATGMALAGTGWAQTDTAGTAQAAASELPELKVSAGVDEAPVVTVGSKTPVTAREVPQSVSVINADQIAAQNLYTLEQAMQQVAGVEVQRIDSNRLSFLARGFEITAFQLDGMPSTLDNRVFLSPDLAMYERVEVLKGPAGVLNGAASTGGSINLVRKRPQRDAAVAGAVSAGSWNDVRIEVDATGALNASGSVRGRTVVSARDRELYYDKGEQQHQLVYGIVETDLSPTTLLTLGASYQDVEARAAQRSLPSFMWMTPEGKFQLALVDVRRENNYGAEWNRDHFQSASVFVELEQQVAETWRAKLALRHADNRYDLVQAYARNGSGDGFGGMLPGIDPSTNAVNMNAVAWNYREDKNEVDAFVDGSFRWLGQEQKLLLGANYAQSEFRDLGDYGNENLGTVNLYQPVVNFPQPTFTPTGDDIDETKQYGLYSNVRLRPLEPLTLVLGGRLSRWEFDTTKYTTAGAVDSRNRSKIDDKFTPFAGLVYDLDQMHSLYASYAEVFKPHDANIKDIAGNSLKPLQGKQQEAGIKGAYLNGTLTTSLAVFEVEEKNRALSDANDPNDEAYVAEGKARSRGVEAEINGQLTPDWSLHAGYVQTRKRYLDDSESKDAGFERYLPEHSFRLWTRYRLPVAEQRWTVGLGAKAVNETYNQFDVMGQTIRLQQSGYTLFDASVGYQITPKVSADLLVTNLGDKKYYQRINTPIDGNIYGDPRAAMLTLRAKF